jgi:hypothetical protein
MWQVQIIGFVEVSSEIKSGQFVHVECGVMKNCKAQNETIDMLIDVL